MFRLAKAAFGLAMLLATIWASFALFYRLPASPAIRGGAAAGLALLGVVAVISLIWRPRLVVILSFVLCFAGIVAWWSSIEPPVTANWAGDVARQVTGTVDGDILTLTDVRNFDWNNDGSFVEKWEPRAYDLSKLKSLDLFMSYWAGPEMAHMILSFSFDDDQYLAWSIEVRRTAGGKFSPLGDLFKSNPLVIIAADEGDVVRVRSNIRGEDVQLFRMRVPPANAARLLLQYVSDANALAEHPHFYNSLTTNCTTTAAKMMRAVGATFPFDWRLIVNGYLPQFAYDRNALDTKLPFEELKAAAHIAARAKGADGSEDFSKAIREGVPSPLD
ncbi:hypothetical protein Rleg4DRAFT_6639 [Rhizobium leguminosarum bv. trifolii WSM2297]|uniref:Lnb N-terminal periplasmic domain-containing protein n=1 Tax=Rhizobium leguminosarum bv. trifolii WSM2297 TaxID=754762 RepID=J0WED6_RHILT|nr:DUF4105 domain-containing protein [Rhizobium leguminosarum]EJC83613.1 hypothetical protein Rleg4DRAFT_5382 [Rhizobium leguminosarum bv. trifolii WSM2297]EJC84796.1 hypothetical protein Rleg4DRAFT_6639 [Rhizobium leguminosarum bv. trifolii WSM2297]